MPIYYITLYNHTFSFKQFSSHYPSYGIFYLKHSTICRSITPCQFEDNVKKHGERSPSARVTACFWFSWTGRGFIGRLDPSVQMSDAPSEFDQSFPGLIPCIWQLASFSFCESFGHRGQAYRKPVNRDQTTWSPPLKWQKRLQYAALLFPVPLCHHVSISAAETMQNGQKMTSCVTLAMV